MNNTIVLSDNDDVSDEEVAFQIQLKEVIEESLRTHGSTLSSVCCSSRTSADDSALTDLELAYQIQMYELGLNERFSFNDKMRERSVACSNSRVLDANDNELVLALSLDNVESGEPARANTDVVGSNESKPFNLHAFVKKVSTSVDDVFKLFNSFKTECQSLFNSTELKELLSEFTGRLDRMNAQSKAWFLSLEGGLFVAVVCCFLFDLISLEKAKELIHSIFQHELVWSSVLPNIMMLLKIFKNPRTNELKWLTDVITAVNSKMLQK